MTEPPQEPWRIGDIITAVTVPIDAVEHPTEDARTRRLTVLAHFLTYMSGESLRRLVAALDRVDHRLIDQGRLLAPLSPSLPDLEPEPIDGTPSQLRGYILMIAGKLPLLEQIDGIITVVVNELTRIPGQRQVPGEGGTSSAERDAAAAYREWKALLDTLRGRLSALTSSIRMASERAQVERDRREAARKQTRVLQEIAAHAGGRGLATGLAGRSPSGGLRAQLLDGGAGSLLLLLAVLGILLAAHVENAGDLKRLMPRLSLPVAIAGVLTLLILLRRWFQQTHAQTRVEAEQGSYDIELPVSHSVDVNELHKATFESRTKRPPRRSHHLKKLIYIPAGAITFEADSLGTATILLQGLVVFRATPRRLARHEVVGEIALERSATTVGATYLSCTIRGVSPRRLESRRLRELCEQILEIAVLPILKNPSVTTTSEILSRGDGPLW